MSIFYLRENGIAPISPPIDAGWTDGIVTNGRRPMFTTPDPTDVFTNIGGFSTLAQAGRTLCHRQFISEPLVAGIAMGSGLSGISGQHQAFQDQVDAGMCTYHTARVVSLDGSVIRYVIKPLTLVSIEWKFQGPAQNRQQSIMPAATGSYTTVEGDRLVVEIGHGDSGSLAPGTITGTTRWGSEQAGTLGGNNTSESLVLSPYFNLQGSFAFSVEGSPDVAGGVATATQVSTAASPWNVTLPAGVAAGDMLLLILRSGGAQTFTLPGGWTALVNNDTSDASNQYTSVFWKIAAGGETSQSVTLSAASKGTAFAYRITGAAASPIPSQAGAIGTSTNATHGLLNPGSFKNYLWIVWSGMDNESITYPSGPTGFTGKVEANSGTAGTNSTNVCSATAWRQSSDLSQLQPDNWSNGVPFTGWTSLVICVHPAPVVPVVVPLVPIMPVGTGAERR